MPEEVLKLNKNEAKTLLNMIKGIKFLSKKLTADSPSVIATAIPSFSVFQLYALEKKLKTFLDLDLNKEG